MYSSVFTAGDVAYNISDQGRSRCLDAAQHRHPEIKRLIAKHPNHTVYLTNGHIAASEASAAMRQKTGSDPIAGGACSRGRSDGEADGPLVKRVVASRGDAKETDRSKCR